MNRSSFARHRGASEYGAGSDGYLYTLHQRMLARYGISYICAHPEILFDPPVEPPRLC